MPLGPSRPSSNEGSFENNTRGDARKAGYAPEEGPTDFEDTTRNAYVSEYPFQIGTEAILSLSAYLEKEGDVSISVFFADASARLARYSASTSGWSYVPSPGSDQYIQISEDGGLTWNRYPITTPTSSDNAKSIRFQRSADQPEVDATSVTGGTGWNDTPSYPSPQVQRRNTLWATVGRVDTNNGNVVEEWSTPFPVIGVHSSHGVVAQYSGGSGNWSDDYDSLNHSQIRFSADHGGSWTSAFTFSNGNVKFQSGYRPPGYDKDKTDPGIAWTNSPTTDTLEENGTLWALRKNPSTDGPTWLEPVQVVTGSTPWQDRIVSKQNDSGKKKTFETRSDFLSLPLSNQELTYYWRLTGGLLESPIVGYHTFDRNREPEFDGNLTVEGQDLILRLTGDEDVRSYDIAVNIGGSEIPDPSSGEHFERQNFEYGLNLGPIETARPLL